MERAPHRGADAPSERSFGLTLAVVLAVVGLVPLFWGEGPVLWLLAAAAALALMALTTPQLLAWPNRLWNGFGHYAGKVTNPLLMAVVFLLLIAPAALVARLLRRDPLDLRLQPGLASYWKPAEPRDESPHESMRRQF